MRTNRAAVVGGTSAAEPVTRMKRETGRVGNHRPFSFVSRRHANV